MTPPQALPVRLDDGWLLRPEGRPLVLVAHAVDLVGAAGLLLRLRGAGPHVALWGVPRDDPRSAAIVDRLGMDRAHVRALDVRTDPLRLRLADVATTDAARDAAFAFFDEEADRIGRLVDDIEPDRVFVVGFEGHEPEHDLLHVMAARATRRLRNRLRAPIPLIELPAIEPRFGRPLRFDGRGVHERRWLRLTPAELTIKRELLREALAEDDTLGPRWLPAPLERALWERVLGEEELGLVPPGRRYRDGPHAWPGLDYRAARKDRRPIDFVAHVRPVVRAILG